MPYVPVFDEPTLNSVASELARARRALVHAVSCGLMPATRAKILDRHVKRFGRQLRRIHAFAAAGARVKTRVEIARALRSYPAKVLAALLHSDVSQMPCVADAIEKSAQQIDLFTPCNDPIRVRVEKKDGGGHRLIHNPGWRHRSRQWILRSVLLSAGVGSEFDANTRGIGANRVIKAMREDIEDGCRFWVIADVKNFYSTVKRGHLRGIMPIDADALSSVIFTGENVPILLFEDGIPIHNSILEKEARLGLAQGSKLSPLIASVLLGGVLRSVVTEANPAVSIVDDIAIGARFHAEAKGFKHALSQRFGSLKAGPLQLKHLRIYDAREGVIYLGLKIRQHCWDGLIQARLTLAPKSHQKVYRRALGRFGEALPELAAQDETNDLDAYLRRSLLGYGLSPLDATIYDLKTHMLLRYLGHFDVEAAYAS